MKAKLIDGKATAERIRGEVKQAINQRLLEGKSQPGLATVLVGENPASKVYVRNKQKACAEVGIHSVGYNLPEETSQEELEALVRTLNADPAISLVHRDDQVSVFNQQCRHENLQVWS